jgi:hypothetical protein
MQYPGLDVPFGHPHHDWLCWFALVHIRRLQSFIKFPLAVPDGFVIGIDADNQCPPCEGSLLTILSNELSISAVYKLPTTAATVRNGLFAEFARVARQLFKYTPGEGHLTLIFPENINRVFPHRSTPTLAPRVPLG